MLFCVTLLNWQVNSYYHKEQFCEFKNLLSNFFVNELVQLIKNLHIKIENIENELWFIKAFTNLYIVDKNWCQITLVGKIHIYIFHGFELYFHRKIKARISVVEIIMIKFLTKILLFCFSSAFSKIA